MNLTIEELKQSIAAFAVQNDLDTNQYHLVIYPDGAVEVVFLGGLFIIGAPTMGRLVDKLLRTSVKD